MGSQNGSQRVEILRVLAGRSLYLPDAENAEIASKRAGLPLQPEEEQCPGSSEEQQRVVEQSNKEQLSPTVMRTNEEQLPQQFTLWGLRKNSEPTVLKGFLFFTR
ncbi:hypothetical protein Y1Q_0005210 [Alligator mississippiensis]|uniref:Uncharacterized protein n=1 Tax=Alligator mississippiensis TaxID=8496 RepID=A0A151MT08_ALLMI|nr:hypothetical protein Y1Q_0005210 [Alligator mississippiensis]